MRAPVREIIHKMPRRVRPVGKAQRVRAGRKKDAGPPISREARAGINGGLRRPSVYRPAV